MSAEPPEFVVYGRPGCGYCTGAVQLLKQQGRSFDYIDIWSEGISKQQLAEKIGHPVYTVPQILHGERYIGGYTDLVPYLRGLDS